MALSNNERAPELLNIVKDAVKEAILAIWTNLPCEVVSYDPDTVTVEVKPLIRVPVRTSEGSIKLIEIKQLQDVPVMFPCAGGFTITHPINVGDECVVTSHRAISTFGGNLEGFKILLILDTMIYLMALLSLNHNHKPKRLKIFLLKIWKFDLMTMRLRSKLHQVELLTFLARK